MAELGITPTEFARQIDVPPNRVSQIINGKRAITGDTALRFGHWFGVEPEFWLNLQTVILILCVPARQSGKADSASTNKGQSSVSPVLKIRLGQGHAGDMLSAHAVAPFLRR